MASVAELIRSMVLETSATPSNLRLGRQIVDEGGVELIESNLLAIKAFVGKVPSAAQKRTVEFLATGDGLKWSCTCTRRADLFCKHCVAAAIVARRGAPKPIN